MSHVNWSYFRFFHFTRRTQLKRAAGRWSFCAGIILWVFSLSAQTRQFRAWSSNEGLSQCFVKAIYKDSSDRLWIGTADGLNQFLGNSFRLYKNYGVPGGRKPSNFLSSDIVEEPGGCLLLTMKDGVYRFDPARQRFSEIQIETGSGLPNDLSYIGTGPDGANWFAVAVGFIFRLEPGETRATMVYASPGREIYYARLLSSGLIFIKLFDSAIVLDPIRKKSNPVIMAGIPQPAVLNGTMYNGSLHLATSVGLLRLNESALKLEMVFNSLEQFNCGVVSFYHDAHSNLNWMGLLSGGVVIADGMDWHLIDRYSHSAADAQSIADGVVNCFYSDELNTMWMGTDAGGLCATTRNRAIFRKYTHRNPRGLEMTSNYVRTLTYLQDRLLIAPLKGGLIVYNPADETSVRSRFPGSESDSALTITAVEVDRYGRTWAGSSGALWLSMDNGLSFRKYASHIAHPIGTVNQILELANGTILVFSTEHTFVVDETNKTLIVAEPGYTPRWVYEDQQGTIWGSSYYGNLFTWKFEKKDEKASLLIGDTLFDEFNVRNFAEDPDSGILWMASEKGILAFNGNLQTSRLYTREDGLSNEFIYSVFLDKRKRVWVTSNQGISCLDRRTGLIRNYSIYDGLQSMEFNSKAMAMAPDGCVYLGGVSGFNSFYPDQIGSPGKTGSAFFLDLKLNGKEVSVDSLLSVRAPVFSYHNTRIEFTAGNSDYFNFNRTVIAYSLQGRDSSWVFVNPGESVSIDGLEKGEYKILLHYINPDGIRSESFMVASFSVLGPVWLQTWFLVISGLFLSALGALVMTVVQRRRSAAVLARLEREREIQQIRLQISRDIHDDIGAGLSRLVLMSGLLPQKGTDSFASKIASTARDLTRQLGQIVWSLNPENDSLRELVYYLRQESGVFFEDSGIALHFSSDEIPPDILLDPRQRIHLIRVIREAMNNTLKYSGASEFHIQISYQPRQISFILSDNGRGFEMEEAIRKGNGLRIMRKRIEEIGGVFRQTSEPGSGTCIAIMLDLRPTDEVLLK